VRHRGLSAVACVLAATLSAACTRVARPADPTDLVAARYLELASALVRQDERSASGDDGVASVSRTTPQVNLSLKDITTQARAAVQELDGLPAASDTELRRPWLRAQLLAVETRARQQAGEPVDLDEEFTRLYGIDLHSTMAGEPPGGDAQSLDAVRTALDSLLPGTGTAAERLDAFDATVTVPAPRLPAVFNAALEECRRRSREIVTLPEGEHVTVRYVVGEPWSGFSAYQGKDASVVSVNTSYPLTVDRVLQLACHEGYPGHHVINVLRDHARATRPELEAVPLFSPEAFATEQVASKATRLVFSDDERTAFERDTLFPLAGLPAAEAPRHVRVARLIEQLSPSIAEALSQFLKQEQGFVETAWMLQRDALMQHPRATIEFAAAFRGIALAYSGYRPAPGSPGGLWLQRAGYPSEPVIMAGNGHHSSASSYRK